MSETQFQKGIQALQEFLKRERSQPWIETTITPKSHKELFTYVGMTLGGKSTNHKIKREKLVIVLNELLKNSRKLEILKEIALNPSCDENTWELTSLDALYILSLTPNQSFDCLLELMNKKDKSIVSIEATKIVLQYVSTQKTH